VALAATTAFQHSRPLVLGEHALELQQQVVLWRSADRPVEKHDLRAGAREFLDQNGLVRVGAGETVGGMHVDEVDGGQGDQVAQALQGGPDQAGPAVAVVEEAERLADLAAIGGRSCQQVLHLTIDRVLLGLLVRRHPSVDRRPDRDDGSCLGRAHRLPSGHMPPPSAMSSEVSGADARAVAEDARTRPRERPDHRAAARSPPSS